MMVRAALHNLGHLLNTCTTVVSMLIVNSEGIDPTSYASVFQAAGLDTLSYSPSSSSLTFSDWPTLGTLIDDGKRLVTFMDTGADFTSVPYIIDGMSLVLSLQGR